MDSATIDRPPPASGGSKSVVHLSSPMLLKIGEMIDAVKPKQRRMAGIDLKLREIKDLIERIPSRKPLPVSEAIQMHDQFHQTRIPFPYPLPGNTAKYRLEFVKPADINVVGSYARRTAIHAGDCLQVDLAIAMPSSLFQPKDYLDFRYFVKRAFYLACIATALQEAEACNFDAEYSYQNDNPLQPILIVTPRSYTEGGSSAAQYQIRLILAVHADSFPLSKTMFDRCCIRLRVEDINHAGGGSPPTPFYNASLRSECSTLAYLKFLHFTAVQACGFNEACILGSVWLRQRGFSTGLCGGGFGPFEWACTMALLLQEDGSNKRPKLSKNYSGYQLFRAMLHFLATEDLMTSSVPSQLDGVHASTTNSPFFLDELRGLNILFKMSPWSYDTIKHEARTTLGLLNDLVMDQFNACFISTSGNPIQKFDYLIQLTKLPQLRFTGISRTSADEQKTLYLKLYASIRRGLGDRVKLLSISTPAKKPWSTTSPSRPAEDSSEILLGLILNPEQIHRTVDKGPSAEEKERAHEFQQFWGAKSELRRFKDGSIKESLIWDSGKDVISQIISSVIERHLGHQPFDIVSLDDRKFESILTGDDFSCLYALKRFQPVMDAFDRLETDIRDLNGLPLQIRQISAADTHLRFASVDPPVLNASRCSMVPANVCVQFEGSKRWPDDIAAVQWTKIAFLQKVSELLAESSSRAISRVGIESTTHAFGNNAFLDILYPSGAFFRIRIHDERELSFLERELRSPSPTAVSREIISSAMSTYKRDFVQAPLHTQTIRTLVTRFPALSASIRLVKIWRDRHLLTSHVSDELAELLTVRSFVHPYPFSTPSTVMAGFLKTLTYISKWDWRLEPLIVDFHGGMGRQELETIRLRFEAWRKIDPAMNRIVMFAASNVDPEGISWTETGPSKVVATRFTRLARAAVDLVVEQGMNLRIERLFETNFSDYDFVIHINTELLEAHQKVSMEQDQFKNLRIAQDKSLAAFSPAQAFVHEIKDLYASSVLFFHEANVGTAVAGLWKPHTQSRSWKTHVGYSTSPIMTSTEKVERIGINKTAILNDIARLGGDIISKIDLR